MPSKTPTLQENKKRSQPFLNSDETIESLYTRVESGGHSTVKNIDTRSRTAFQRDHNSKDPYYAYSSVIAKSKEINQHLYMKRGSVNTTDKTKEFGKNYESQRQLHQNSIKTFF